MPADKPRVSTQILLHIVEQLAGGGVDPAPLLAEAAIDPAGLADIERMIPLPAYVRFFERAADRLGDAHFGLRAARASDDGALGALSFLFMSAPNLEEAFRGFVQYLSVMQEGTLMELRPGAAGAMHFVYQLRGHEITPRRQDSEYSIAATFRLVDQYMPGRFKPREIYFEHERRGAYQIYADYFGCDVFFGQTINAIVFDPAILSTRSPRLSTRLYPIISAHLQSAMTHRTGAARIADQVGLCLTDEILGGRVTIAQVAARLGLSATALARRLATEGVSFREVLGARRMASAERLLLESRAPISEIALRVGYGENASFTRAFRRHGGQTPEQFRVAARRAADSDTAQDRTRPGIRNDR